MKHRHLAITKPAVSIRRQLRLEIEPKGVVKQGLWGKDRVGREVELKLMMRPEDRVIVETMSCLRDALNEARHATLRAVYFDTKDHALSKQRMTLRIRSSDGKRVETLKRDAASGAERGEWEQETTRDVPDLALLREACFADLIAAEALEGQLGPVFEARVERVSFDLLEQGTRIEGALDTGHIEAEGRRLALCELELELKEGDRGALFDIARRLSATAPLRLGLISKAERGYRLAEGTWGGSVKGSKPRLAKGLTCLEAFQTLAFACLHDFMLNEAALLTDDEAEAVHQARVAVRRLRAAITLFRPMLADSAFERLREDLKWHADLLGEARDLDVFRETWPRLAGRVEERRRAAHCAFSDALTTKRSRIFFVDLAAWLDGGEWQGQFGELAHSSVVDFATSRLAKRRRRLVVQGRDLDELDPQTRHKIRIDAKKLRYMAEFFSGVRGVARRPKLYKDFIRALADLQEALGAMHDHEVGAEMAARIAGLSPEEAKAETGGPVDTRKDLARAVRAHEQLSRTQPF